MSRLYTMFWIIPTEGELAQKTADCIDHVRLADRTVSVCDGQVPVTADDFVKRFERCMNCNRHLAENAKYLLVDDGDTHKEAFNKIAEVTGACASALSTGIEPTYVR